MKKVFILGAGASLPYGLPSGNQLKEQIIDVALLVDCSKKHHQRNELVADFCEILKQTSTVNIVERFRAFGRDFKGTNLNSIDKFLNLKDYREKYEDIGKLLITYLILRQEQKELIYDPLIDFKGQNWMSYLWNNEIFDHNLKSIISKQLTIITFNYDRTLEYFLGNVISKTFPSETIDIYEIFEIIHVYGKVGHLGSLKDGKENVNQDITSFGQWESGEILNQIKNDLNLIYEARKDKKLNDKIARILAEADKIYFTGFGFDESNMRILGFNGYSKREGVKIYGNAYGMKEGEKEKIMKYDNFDELPDNLNNLEFLRTYL